jgi:hypothetical protein
MLNTRLGKNRINGREFIDGPSGDKFRGRKNDKKSFDSSRTIKKNIPISNND